MIQLSSFGLRLSLLLVLTLLCSACAVRTWEDTAPQPPVRGEGKAASEDEQAEMIWQRFSTQAATAEVMTGPFRIAANLRYTDPQGESARVSALLWGNGNADTPYPLRLDLMAGVGSVISKIQEDSNRLLAYSPQEKTAYVQEGGDRQLASFGVPIPMTLGDLTLLLSGRAGQLFLPAGAQALALPPYHNLSADSVNFTLPAAKLPGILELSSLGVPLSWKELRENGWTIAFEPGEANPLQPQKLRISHPTGYNALIVVKDISRVSPPFTSAQMTLVLPPETPTKPLQPEER